MTLIRPSSGNLFTIVNGERASDSPNAPPREGAKAVRIPTFLYQVHDDVLTTPDGVKTMFDNTLISDKRIHWIRGTTARWDGCLEFQRRPQPMLEWFNDYI
jgi:uncharacterized protein